MCQKLKKRSAYVEEIRQADLLNIAMLSSYFNSMRKKEGNPRSQQMKTQGQ